jgi:hypothetical protein
MLDWIKKLGRNHPWRNHAGLDETALGLLSEDLGSLEKLSADLASETLRYLLDGEWEEAVLTQLAVTNGAGEALGFRGPVLGVRENGETTRSRFFRHVRCEKPEFFIRLGRIYDAATRSRQSRLLNQFPQVAAQVSQQQTFRNLGLNWLELLLIEATALNLHSWPRRCHSCPALTADLVEAMLKLEGHSPELLMRSAFQPQLERFGGPPLEPVFTKMVGIAEAAVRQKKVIEEVLSHVDFRQRVYALSMMKNCSVPVEPFLDKLVELAVSSSKAVRQQARILLVEASAAARPVIERKILSGTNDEKVLAVALLWDWERESARSFLQGRLAEEKNRKVLRAIEDALVVTKPVSAPARNAVLELPPIAPIASHATLGAETERAWEECFQKVNAGIASINAGQAGKSHAQTLAPVTPDAVRRSFELMQSGSVENQVTVASLTYGACHSEAGEPIRKFWQRPELHLIHLVRFLVQIGWLRSASEGQWGDSPFSYWSNNLISVFQRAHPDAGLRELGAAFTAAGLDARRIGVGLLQSYFESPTPFGLAPARIWPYWAENLDLLEQALAPSSGDFMSRFYQRHARRNAFHALASFPHPPEKLVPILWKMALGPKTERPSAQRCLEDMPKKVERLIDSLRAGDAETRLAAAEWLGRIGDTLALEPLLAALKRERNETAKGVIMSALELLGAPVDQFLDRDALLTEAEKGVGKGVPEDLKWFPFGQLPAVHWLDNGKRVDHAVLQWWLIQGYKLKNPEPGPLLRKYCASFKPTEREALGQFVLETWIGKDTSPRVGAEAENEAMRRAQAAVQAAQQWAQWVKQNPQMAQRMAAFAPQQKSLQEYYADLLPVVQREPTGTAISSKGILSLAGACAGAGAAPVVGRYLKDWYGMRVAQCRAMLQMLAWVEHKTATQLLLSVGSRFRTKSIQEEASKQAQALAERKGWTVAELADRTIPTAGLDDEGVLTIDFGPRQFTAKLNEDLEFLLADPEGKPLKSLPDPRKEDDVTKAAQAKKVYSAAKKELKSVITMQRDRLYEAMCTQRTWPFEDWNTYLNRHPIARHHCQRLVWSVLRDGKAGELFRPLADGSLTDANDDPVTVSPEASIRVAHECLVTPEQSQIWRQHFKDYEVEPLFEQFGRPNFDLPEERKQEDELEDFRGHVLEAFKLRGRANKLGYTRGQAQDGGWFFDYHKRFPTLGIEAVLEFTGNGLPEENREVALTTLHFERAAPEAEPVNPGSKMALGEVPPVLLSECWNDIRQIAAEGSGFDPDWEKKTQP